MRYLIALYLSLLFIPLAKSEVKPLILEKEKYAYFGARVSKINNDLSLMRLKIDFSNAKFLNKKDKIEFWSGTQRERRCVGYLVGKSNEYILVKVPSFEKCKYKLDLAVSAYISIYSEDLSKNILVVQELMMILLKKRMALQGRMKKEQKELDLFFDKVDAVNIRYESLKRKLELEWQQEIASLEHDRAQGLRNYQSLQLELGEIDNKLEIYKVNDHNLDQDRWALDPRKYYLK